MKRKKIILASFFILLLIGITGCQKTEDNIDSITFTGTITAIEDSRIFVDADNEFDTVYINIADTTTIKLKNGSDGTIKDLNVEDKISVEFSGMVATSEPPQITATDIEVK